MNQRHFFILFIFGFLFACTSETEPNSNSLEENIEIEDSIEEVEFPNAEYAVYKYDSILQADILTYQYSDLWDIDGDGSMDTIAFIGNGGVHQYFHLEIKLSSESNWTQYKYLNIDMPYLDDSLKIDEIGNFYPQFAVFDFDEDSLDEIYIYDPDPISELPVELFNQGINSKRVVIDYRENQLVIEKYIPYKSDTSDIVLR